MFQYQNPVIAFLVKIANMLIASFCWLLGCIPIVTLLPACAALHTTVDRAVFTGRPVVRTFWEAYRSAMKPGISLSIGCQVLGRCCIWASVPVCRSGPPAFSAPAIWRWGFCWGRCLL